MPIKKSAKWNIVSFNCRDVWEEKGMKRSGRAGKSDLGQSWMFRGVARCCFDLMQLLRLFDTTGLLLVVVACVCVGPGSCEALSMSWGLLGRGCAARSLFWFKKIGGVGVIWDLNRSLTFFFLVSCVHMD